MCEYISSCTKRLLKGFVMYHLPPPLFLSCVFPGAKIYVSRAPGILPPPTGENPVYAPGNQIRQLFTPIICYSEGRVGVLAFTLCQFRA